MSNKKQRQLESDWQLLLKRHAAPLERGAKAKGVKAKAGSLPRVVDAASNVPPKGLSKVYDQMRGSTAPKASPVYTGSKMLGVGVMHKSNAVPVFSSDDAESLARMRR